MAVLDTFYLLFKSDTSDLKHGVDEVKKIIGGLSKVLSAAIPAAFGIAGIKKAIDYGIELSNTSRKIGANAADIQAWGNAVELAGGDAKQFEGTLVSLATKFGTTSDTILKVLPRYADLLGRLSPSRAQQIGKNLGLDESTILLLQRGRREVEDFIKRQKELGGLTKEDTEKFKNYNESVIKSSQAFSRLNQVLALTAIPVLTRFFDILDKSIIYFIDHKDLVIGGLIAMSIFATVAAFSFGLISLPLIGITALILGVSALFAIVYEDVQAFLHGQNSLIGYILNHYPSVGKVVKAFFNGISTAINAVLHPLDSLEKLLDRIISKFKSSPASKLFGALVHGDLAKAKEAFNSARDISRDKSLVLGRLGNSSTNSNTVNTGPITINTQAIDAQGIASNLKDRLDQQYAQVANYHSDGVIA
jgi:hypothetical protein